jgi:hypothetical protein
MAAARAADQKGWRLNKACDEVDEGMGGLLKAALQKRLRQ